jgi:hypothetical protein
VYGSAEEKKSYQQNNIALYDQRVTVDDQHEVLESRADPFVFHEFNFSLEPQC